MRAELPNPDPAQARQFVRVRLSGGARRPSEPQRAVPEGPQGKFVFVAGSRRQGGDEAGANRRMDGGDVVVIGGLTAGEKVIVDGVLKLGPACPGSSRAARRQAARARRCPAAAPGARAPARRREVTAMFSRFFIDRPIFAMVLSIFIVIAGLAAMRSLPIAQYPEIAPPQVLVPPPIPAPPPSARKPSPPWKPRSTASRA